MGDQSWNDKTLTDAVDHKCSKFIQNSFEGQLEVIMDIMSKSLYDGGKKENLSESEGEVSSFGLNTYPFCAYSQVNSASYLL